MLAALSSAIRVVRDLNSVDAVAANHRSASFRQALASLHSGSSTYDSSATIVEPASDHTSR